MLFAFAIAFAIAVAEPAECAALLEMLNAFDPNPPIAYAKATVVISLMVSRGTCAARLPAAGHCASPAICTIAVLFTVPPIPGLPPTATA